MIFEDKKKIVLWMIAVSFLIINIAFGLRYFDIVGNFAAGLISLGGFLLTYYGPELINFIESKHYEKS